MTWISLPLMEVCSMMSIIVIQKLLDNHFPVSSSGWYITPTTHLHPPTIHYSGRVAHSPVRSGGNFNASWRSTFNYSAGPSEPLSSCCHRQVRGVGWSCEQFYSVPDSSLFNLIQLETWSLPAGSLLTYFIQFNFLICWVTWPKARDSPTAGTGYAEWESSCLGTNSNLLCDVLIAIIAGVGPVNGARVATAFQLN